MFNWKASLSVFRIELSGGQPQMYRRLCCAEPLLILLNVKRLHEIMQIYQLTQIIDQPTAIDLPE